MECPHCGLINPDVVQRCDCGYDFDLKRVANPPHQLTDFSQKPLSLLGKFRRRIWIFVILAAVVAVAVFVRGVLTNPMRAGQTSCPGILRTLHTVEVTFASTYQGGFTDGLHRLGPPPSGNPNVDHADLVFPVYAGRGPGGTNFGFEKAGCKFTYTPGKRHFGSIPTYTITAEQVEFEHGRKNFFIDETGVIRGTIENRTATAKDPPLYGTGKGRPLPGRSF